MKPKRSSNEIREAVRKHYGDAISRSSSCCGPQLVNIDSDPARQFVQLAGYTDHDTAGLPESVTSFGCGNPVNFLNVCLGQTVLDLGSGAGLDLILAARKVGPTGRVIGLDMTPQMIEVCRRNLKAAGVVNGEVRQGEMEQMPVVDNEIDWIISNCVINLSPEKKKVFAEAFRVLKPGGGMLVSDIVTLDFPDQDRDDILAWVGCIAGAVEEDDYVRLVHDAGFTDVEIVDKVIYSSEALATLTADGCCGDASTQPPDRELVDKYAGHVASVKLRARKPA